MLETAGEIAHGLFVAMIGPVVVTGPGAASVRERVEEERIELLGASSSEGAVRWSKRLHFPCKSRCRSSGYWRELGMDSSLFIPTAHGFNLFPTATVPCPKVRSGPSRRSVSARPAIFRRTRRWPLTAGPRPIQTMETEFQRTIGEVLRSLAHVDGREASLEKSGDRREDNEVLG